MRNWFRRHLLFVVFVIAPNIVAIIYFGLLASDVFISESRFVARSPQKQVQGGLVGQLLQGSGISHSQDDAYAVRDYILSRDALTELSDRLGLRQMFGDHHVDALNRFPGIFSHDDSFERFYRYYGKHVNVEYDPVSSISILTVNAYTAKDANRINTLLLDMSERLVNTLNDQSRHDLIDFAEKEVQLASEKAKDASMALLSYRSKQSVFEPDKQAALQLEGVAKIQQELVSTEAALAQIKKLSPDSPQIRSLTSRVETLRKAIASEAAKITGAQGSFSARAPTYERLALDVEFADKQLGVALAELESARSEALQKQLYLERLVQPSLPDEAMEPMRIRSIFTVFLFSLVAWGVASLLVASVREHAD